ncbi:Phage tail fiber repeat family protein [Trichomonas vaginalis G3]|uniref:Phage tail fiber repeat family protein n=1 Tax=Trichomonas vaginalis (strain ATCC PRA-98 / G3) TaxID=412133 RepID=A2FEE1_TRIV3|nr:Phage tail fiber repeat family protein [Trichomonas vaginalis G3]|eukprot:XP_001309658.1 Phage tail fiber repeat family protein [Trichomonas vaginalis G3]
MSNETASMREIQHNRQLIIQALNKNTTNFSNYSKISESLKEGNLKLTLNPMTDEFLFQDKKNHTVCINPTKGTLNEKPIKELLLKADVDNKADKTYVDDAIAKEEERADKAYATKEHTHPELADKTYVDNKMSSEVTRAENEYSKKTHIHSISDITNLQETLETKANKTHTHTIANITNLQETLNRKSDVGHTHTIANITNLQETLNSKSDVGHTHSISEITDLNVSLEKKADKTELQTLKTEILQTLYPVGSLYVSMNSTRPEVVLGFGTWKQIVDKFLYCARYSKQTGGSKKIKEANLPPHTHTGTTNTTGNHSHSITKRGYINLAAGSDRWGMNRYDITTDPVDSSTGIFCGTAGNHSHTFTTNPTGSGKDYMPPFVTVFAWYRNA